MDILATLGNHEMLWHDGTREDFWPSWTSAESGQLESDAAFLRLRLDTGNTFAFRGKGGIEFARVISISNRFSRSDIQFRTFCDKPAWARTEMENFTDLARACAS